ncbi:MAG TPA: divergent polysaccharide deacetylase family protein [Candidatus Megaira endosymbiont of Hartmannula sinica]|nr:divergent polysaccharide deacetylase family protein [Candidatus Megaera endosymbiont of Hartmannula sinica]
MVLFWLLLTKPQIDSLAKKYKQYLYFSLNKQEHNSPYSTVNNSDDLLKIVQSSYSKNSEADNSNSTSVSVKNKNSEINNLSNSFNIDENNKKHNITISIFIANMGLNPKVTSYVIDNMPSEVSLGFIAYSHITNNFIEKAKDKNHDVYLYIAMSDKKTNSIVNKYQIRGDLTYQENALRINNITMLQNNINGFYSIPSEDFTSNKKNSDMLFSYLDGFNYKFILSSNNLKSKEFSKEYSLVQDIDIIVDDDNDKIIQEKLNHLLEISKEKGHANIYFTGLYKPLNYLNRWIKETKNNNMVFNINIIPIARKN